MQIALAVGSTTKVRKQEISACHHNYQNNYCKKCSSSLSVIVPLGIDKR